MGCSELQNLRTSERPNLRTLLRSHFHNKVNSCGRFVKGECDGALLVLLDLNGSFAFVSKGLLNFTSKGQGELLFLQVKNMNEEAVALAGFGYATLRSR